MAFARDHTGVIHACNAVACRRETDPEFAQASRDERYLTGSSGPSARTIAAPRLINRRGQTGSRDADLAGMFAFRFVIGRSGDSGLA
jgi:hypothetical protein